MLHQRHHCQPNGQPPATPVAVSSEWQLTINSTAHRINVQYQGVRSRAVFQIAETEVGSHRRTTQSRQYPNAQADCGGSNWLSGPVGKEQLICSGCQRADAPDVALSGSPTTPKPQRSQSVAAFSPDLPLRKPVVRLVMRPSLRPAPCQRFFGIILGVELPAFCEHGSLYCTNDIRVWMRNPLSPRNPGAILLSASAYPPLSTPGGLRARPPASAQQMN
jgi:hypothetical protein